MHLAAMIQHLAVQFGQELGETHVFLARDFFQRIPERHLEPDRRAMAIDAETRKPRISNITAGLSGPAIKPIAVRMVWEAAKTVKIPVIGLGGISTAEDVIEFLLAGATAVEVGTVNFWDPCACETLVDSLEKWCVEHRIEKISELTGGLQVN